MALPQQPKDPNETINRRFDLLRQRQEQAGNAAKQTAQEDIQRQAAARGRLGSGIVQKQQGMAQEQIDKQQGAALQDVESGREQALFQQSEADMGRKFAAEQALLGRQFAREERLGGQEFAGQQAREQMNFQTAERLGAQGFNRELFDKNMQWQEKVFNQQNKQFDEQMDFQFKSFRRQIELDEANSEFNKMMAEKNFNKPELMDIMWQSSGRNAKSGKFEGFGALGLGGDKTGTPTVISGGVERGTGRRPIS